MTPNPNSSLTDLIVIELPFRGLVELFDRLISAIRFGAFSSRLAVAIQRKMPLSLAVWPSSNKCLLNWLLKAYCYRIVAFQNSLYSFLSSNSKNISSFFLAAYGIWLAVLPENFDYPLFWFFPFSCLIELQ